MEKVYFNGLLEALSSKEMKNVVGSGSYGPQHWKDFCGYQGDTCGGACWDPTCGLFEGQCMSISGRGCVCTVDWHPDGWCFWDFG